jgi:isoamylase
LIDTHRPDDTPIVYSFGHRYQVAGRSLLALGLATDETLTRRLRQGLGAIMDVTEFPLPI